MAKVTELERNGLRTILRVIDGNNSFELGRDYIARLVADSARCVELEERLMRIDTGMQDGAWSYKMVSDEIAAMVSDV